MVNGQRNPAEGERAAIAGFHGQYSVAAVLILRALYEGTLESLRIADPDAGRVDDFILCSPGSVDAFQVKWSVYPGRLRFNDLSSQGDETRGLIRDLAEGWQRLRTKYPEATVRVHLVTHDHAHAESKAFLPVGGDVPDHVHFAAFLAEAWPVGQREAGDVPDCWQPAWDRLALTSGLSTAEFEEFARCCHFDCGFSVRAPSSLPIDEQEQFDTDRAAIASTLFRLVADPTRVIELAANELLAILNWEGRLQFRNPHEFPVDSRYEPIATTVEQLRDRLTSLSCGYIAVVGSPGSGKSSLLTETLRSVEADVVSYYAFVPYAADVGPLRGEAESFLHDVTAACRGLGLGRSAITLNTSDLNALRRRLARQLSDACERYQATGRKLVLLVDGLDHIEREQNPVRSLLDELPRPDQIPEGVLIIVGTQRVDLLGAAIRATLGKDGRLIEMSPMPRDAMLRALDRTVLPVDLSAEQRESLMDRANGHPLAFGYLLNRLAMLDADDDIDEVLSSEARYEGDIDAIYLQHWEHVKSDAAVVDVLARVCRWLGSFDSEWFATWSGSDAVDRLLLRFRHFLRREAETRWLLFHNSFRLFLVDRTAENPLGEFDAERDRRYHRDLAQACERADDAYLSAQALKYWYAAGAHAQVVQSAGQARFRSQFIACRPSQDIQRDVGLALASAAETSDVGAMAKCILAGFELHQRTASTDDVAIADYLLRFGQVDLAISHLRDGTQRLVSQEAGLEWALHLLRHGIDAEARRLFEISEPLNLIRQREPIESGRNGEENGALCAWAEAAVSFRSGDEVLAVIARIRQRAGERGGREDTDEASTARLRGEMLHRVGRGALAQDDSGLLERTVAAFERSNGWHVRPRLALMLDMASECSTRLDAQAARETTLAALEYALEWRLSLPIRLDVAEAVVEHVRDPEVVRELMEDVEPPPLGDDVRSKSEIGLKSVRFRLNRVLAYLDGKSDANLLVPDANDRHDEAIVKVAREQCRIGQLWGLAWRGVQLHPAEVIDRCRGALHVFNPARRPSSHHQGWYNVTPGRPGFYSMLVRAVAAHGVVAVAQLVKEMEMLWTDERSAPNWGPSLRRSVASTLFAVGWNREWVVKQLEDVESSLHFVGAADENVKDGVQQAEVWLGLGELERAGIAPRAVARPHRCRP